MNHRFDIRYNARRRRVRENARSRFRHFKRPYLGPRFVKGNVLRRLSKKKTGFVVDTSAPLLYFERTLSTLSNTKRFRPRMYTNESSRTVRPITVQLYTRIVSRLVERSVLFVNEGFQTIRFA